MSFHNPDATGINRELVDLIPALRAFARTLHRDVGGADDLVQETLTRAIAHIDQYAPNTRLKSWLFTIMRNTFNTNCRRNKREGPAVAACASARRSVEATQEWAVQGLEIKDAIDRLPPEQRQVLVLIAMLGTSYEDAASICSCNIGTIKSRLNRARTRLLKELGEPSIKAAVAKSGYLSRHQWEDMHIF